MTLDEMKLAVCEKLPEIVYIWEQKYWKGGVVTSTEKMMSWKNTDDLDVINWPTEGLQVCHEAEKLLGGMLWKDYINTLIFVVDGGPPKVNMFFIYCATYEQRLEALCRVWFPERFTR